MKCPNCRATLADGSQFCNQCGSKTAGGDPVSQRPAAAFDQAKRPRDESDKEVDNEQMLWEGSYSGKSMIGTWILAVLGSGALIGIAAALHMTPLVAFAPVIWIAVGGLIGCWWVYLFCVLLYRKWSVHYELTDQRFIHRTGILSRRTDRIELIDIDDVSFSQGFIERLAGVGAILISSSDQSHPELLMRGIASVEEISNIIDDARRKERRRRGLHIESI